MLTDTKGYVRLLAISVTWEIALKLKYNSEMRLLYVLIQEELVFALLFFILRNESEFFRTQSSELCIVVWITETRFSNKVISRCIAAVAFIYSSRITCFPRLFDHILILQHFALKYIPIYAFSISKTRTQLVYSPLSVKQSYLYSAVTSKVTLYLPDSLILLK